MNRFKSIYRCRKQWCLSLFYRSIFLPFLIDPSIWKVRALFVWFFLISLNCFDLICFVLLLVSFVFFSSFILFSQNFFPSCFAFSFRSSLRSTDRFDREKKIKTREKKTFYFLFRTLIFAKATGCSCDGDVSMKLFEHWFVNRSFFPSYSKRKQMTKKNVDLEFFFV